MPIRKAKWNGDLKQGNGTTKVGRKRVDIDERYTK